MADDRVKDEEVRLLYQLTVSDLSYFKSQQWSVTNYSLLLFAGLIATYQFLKPVQGWERILFVAIAWLVGVAAVVVLSKLQRSIQVRQARLTAARRRFSRSFQEVWEAETKEQEYVHAIYFLYAAVGGTLMLCTWLMGFRL
jgi:hypothetical protein